jgi:hypothetical protein
MHEFFPKFDVESISKICAEKEGIDQKEIKDRWQHISKVASHKGKNVHELAENYIISGKVPKILDEEEEKYFFRVKQKIDRMLQEYELVSAERILFSKKLGIAGTADLIMRGKNDNSLYIFDWKTSNSIAFTNPQQRAYPPIENLDDCNFNHYSVQLNIYKRLIEEEDYYPEYNSIKMAFLKIDFDQVKAYKLSDLTQEIDLMLKYSRKKTRSLLLGQSCERCIFKKSFWKDKKRWCILFSNFNDVWCGRFIDEDKVDLSSYKGGMINNDEKLESFLGSIKIDNKFIFREGK